MCTSLKSVWDSDVYVGSNLVGMYPKMWSIQDAWSLFNKNPLHENLSFGTCKTWATTKGTGTVSTNLQQEGILWNSVTFGSFARVG
jgi:hypothetical protein